jgi:predicted deacylase
VAPRDLDFESRGRRDYFVRLEHPTLWAHYLIPLTVMVGPGARPGRGLLATGSTHGDEYEGPAALKHLLREIPIERVRGRLVLVPVLNVMAFKAGRRESPDDGGNLNRLFPGDSRGTVTSRLADFVTRFLFPHAHVVMDLHAGGEVARFALHASFPEVKDPARRKETEETARGFGSRFVRAWRATAAHLHGTARDQGKITIGGEFGWGRALLPEGVSMVKQGVLTAAVRQGELEGPPPPPRHVPREAQILVDTTDPASDVLAAFEGHFEPSVALGDRVEAGQPTGFLHDFNRLDDPPFELRAPHPGFVMSQAWGARVVQGQIVTQLGKPLEWMK